MTSKTTVSLKCSGKNCPTVLRLELESNTLDHPPIRPGLEEAAARLFWRMLDNGNAYCMRCCDARGIVCARCVERDCFCMGGPYLLGRTL